MPYTHSDILQLQTLAYHSDLTNVRLALELLKGNGWDQRLSTALYWMAFRFDWEKEWTAKEEIEVLVRQYVPALLDLEPLLEWVQLPMASIFKDHLAAVQRCALSCEELAKAMDVFFLPRTRYQAITPFLFRFGTEAMQQVNVPYLIRKQYTRVDVLDLSGYQFGVLPAGLVASAVVRELNLDGNRLSVLPDHWERWQKLEVLHLTNNHLTTLPPSFVNIRQLKRLYIQNNPWQAAALTQVLRQLPALEYLSVAVDANDPLYRLEALVQKGLLQASEQEQRLFLALELQEEAALSQLSLLDLFVGLQQKQTEVRTSARKQLLARNVLPLESALPAQAAIAILGLVSFAARERLKELEQEGWTVSNEITTQTTHVVLGDYPEQYEAVVERPFIFLSEQELFLL